MKPIRAAEIARRRLASQRLIGRRMVRPADVVRWLGAVQSQDFGGARWGVGQRTAGCDDAAVELAFDQGAFLRTHVMRPTWHLVAPEDLRWLLRLTAPRVHQLSAPYYRKVGIDPTLLAQTDRLLEHELQAGRYRTRTEIAHALAEHSIEARGIRLAYLLMHAELEGLICSGPRRGKQHTYALLEERVPPSPAIERSAALVELVRRFFTSHGPATARDFAWWSGLKVADAEAGLAALGDDVERLVGERFTYWHLPPTRTTELASPIVHLLPNYDEHAVAYKDRAATLSGDPDRETLVAHLIAVDGLIVGGWRRTIARGAVTLTTMLKTPLRGAKRRALADAAERLGRFLGLPVAVV